MQNPFASQEEAVLEAVRECLPEQVAIAGTAATRTELALSEEVAATERMVPMRAAEFLTGRTCARRCLRELAVEDTPLLAAADRAPCWPDSVAGSISHTRGFCVAAVAPRSLLGGIGIDIEQVGAVGAELGRYVALPAETRRHAEVEDLLTLLFSIKESVFKCLYPLSKVWLDFQDVEVAVGPDGYFRATARGAFSPPVELRGRTRSAAGFVVSAVAVAAEDVAGLRPSWTTG